METDEYAVGVDRWCDEIRALDPTFSAKSLTVPLSIADGLALSRHSSLSLDQPSDDDGAALERLRQAVAHAIEQLGGRVFVKLSTRSAKDVVYDERNVMVEAALPRELAAAGAARLPQDCPADRATAESAAVEAWLSACAGAFLCTSAADAIDGAPRARRAEAAKQSVSGARALP